MRVSIVAMSIDRIKHNWRQWADQPVIISKKLRGSWHFNGPSMAEEREKGFVFYAGGVAIGSVGVLKKGGGQLKIGGVCKLAVDPVFRRNGVASQLMKMVASYLATNRFHVGALWKGNGVSSKFYESFGYYSLNGSDVMVKDLEGPHDPDRILETIRKEGIW